MKKYRYLRIIIMFATLIGFGSGCVTPPTKPAINLDASFNPADVDWITLLPAVDGRLDKSEKVKIQRHVANPAWHAIKRRKYKIEAIEEEDSTWTITKADLETADSEWIKKLGPENARWLVVVMLNDVSTKMTFGSTGNADVTGYLFDKQEGKLVWYDKGVGQAGQGGLLGMVMKGSMDSEAILVAVQDLFLSLPLRPKSK